MANVRGLFGFLSLILGLVLWTKIDTTLEYKLRTDFQYSPSIIALFYTIQFLGYLLVSPFCHKFLERFNGTLLTVLSFYVIGIASFLIGPSDIMNMPNSIYLIVSGLFITGLATSFTTIGTFQEMYLPFVELNKGAYDKDKLGDVLAGLYNGAYSIGVIIGPFTASYLMILLDNSFSKQSDIFAFFTLAFATLMLFTVYVPNRLKK